METPALAMSIFGVLITGLGLIGLLTSQILLSVPGFSPSTSMQLFVTAFSRASLVMGLLCLPLATIYMNRIAADDAPEGGC